LGVVSPEDFIPLAEESGLIVPLGEQIIREACRWAKRWSESEASCITVAVNISVAQFRSNGLIDFVRSTLRELELDPAYLQFELTESVLMQDINKTIKLLKELDTIGTQLWIDDFGTGYSSMSYLKQLPISGLKIDRSFVHDMDTNEDDASIVAAIIALARSLGLGTVAEGVESKTQLELLAEQGCEIAQGYYFSCPLSASAMEKWMQERHREDLQRMVG
jgi:EAL domain-containing protein (putative c-di-GMP-specific phosphodiesterase class I)